MTLEQIEYGFRFIQWLLERKVGVAVIGTTGGEPTLHPSFWSEYMPRLNALKASLNNGNIFELHTNGSSEIHPAYKVAYAKFFRTSFVGHDMCHRMFAPLSDLELQDLSDITENLTLNQNEYFLRKVENGVTSMEQAIFVRKKGRAAESIANGRLEAIAVQGHPKLACTWHEEQRSGDCLHFAFTPDHINHCGEKSHPLPPLPDGSKIDEGQFHPYTMDFDKLFHAGLDYTTKYSGENCSQKCMSYFCKKAVKSPLKNLTVSLTEDKKHELSRTS